MKWKFWEKLTPDERAELRAAGLDGPDESVIADVEARVEARLAEERAKDQTAMRAERKSRFETEAGSRADDLIRAGQLTPPERAAYVAHRATAALEDRERPVAAGESSRVASFDAVYAARPKHGLFREYIDPGTGKTVKADVLRNPTDGSVLDISTPAGAAAAATMWAEKQNGAQGNGAAKH